MSLLLLFSGSSSISQTSSDTGSSVDSGVVLVSSTDTGSGVDTSSLSAVLSGFDSGSFTDLASLLAQVSEVDTALSSDTSVTSVQTSGAESFAGVDTSSLLVGISQTDLAAFQDLEYPVASSTDSLDSGVSAELFAVTVLMSDVGNSTETAVVSVVLSDQDTGQGTDLAAVGVTPLFSWEEYGVDSEVELVLASISFEDSASFVETAVVTVSSVDTCSLSEDAGFSTAASDTDSGLFTAAESLSAQLVSGDTTTTAESSVVLVSTTGVDSGAGVDFETLGSPVFGSDSVTAVESWSVVASQSSVDTASGADVARVSVASTDVVSSVDSQAVLVSLSSTDTAGSAESAYVSQALSSVDTAFCAEDASVAISVLDSDSAIFSESGLVVVPVSDVDFAVFVEGGSASLPVAPVSVLDDLSPSVVEVLRMSSTRVNGSLSVSWVPISELVSPSFSAIRPHTVWNRPTVGGQLVVRFDLQFVRPGVMQLPPPQQGTMPDRVGVLFADPSAAEWLRAGDRVRCLSGPVDGTFEIRVTPDLALGYGSAHHLEVEVVEVSQAPTGTHVPVDFDYQLYPSYIRSLYATHAEVLRLSLSNQTAGSAQSSWVKVTDMVDPLLGIPGELMCRITTSFLRPGKDQPVPIVAGRAPDRVGVLYADLTPFLKAGDRIHCLAGDVYGTFELRVTPDLAPNAMSIGHLEVQVIEVSQSLATYGH